MLLGNRFSSIFRTAARGLEAQRIAMSTSAENMANASTSRTEEGEPYAIKRATHAVADENYDAFRQHLNEASGRMRVYSSQHLDEPALRRKLRDADLGPITEVQEEVKERLEYDPSHPHADENGYVHYPDVSVVEEMSRMMSANRLYEANLSTVQAAKEMIKRTLEI